MKKLELVFIYIISFISPIITLYVLFALLAGRANILYLGNDCGLFIAIFGTLAGLALVFVTKHFIIKKL
jgi:hypothetical protein